MANDGVLFFVLLKRTLAYGGIFIGILLWIIVAYGLYNVFLHPLSKYPGPKLWAAYRMPYVICAWKGELPFKVLDLHRKYGPVVRIAPDELAFTDGRAFSDLQSLLPDRTQHPKDVYPYGPNLAGPARHILLASDRSHARLRRIYGPCFTPQALEEQSGMLMKYANLLISTLKERIKTNPAQDMSAFFNFVTFDLTGEFTFDEPFHCLDSGGNSHFYLKTVLGGVVDGFRIMQLQRYGVWSMMKPLLPKSAFQGKADMDSYTEQLVEKRRQRGYIPGKADVFNYLLQNKNEHDQLTLEEMIDNGNVLVVAGSETTATLLAGVTYHLCRNAEVLKKVASEVRLAFRTDEEITVKAVDDLPYLIAVLTEGLRIFPPTAWGWARVMSGADGRVIAGNYVPRGNRCAVFHWAAYHSESNFARPDEFCPERWLPDAPAEFNNDNRDALQPFHMGPRGCLGKNLAYAEMRLLMSKMLFHFDMELADPNFRWVENMKTFSVWGRTPLLIKLTPVQR